MNNRTNGSLRIGFYVCHCGHNIGAMVDCPAVAAYIARLPGVVVSRDYKYMCSDPGQELIQQDIREHHLNRVVVASCSPLLHEHTFRTAVERGGLNPFYFQMVNIREHDSWVHTDRAEATAKAKALAHAAIHRVRFHQPLETHAGSDPSRTCWWSGGGIAGIHAALTLGNAGKKVFLVEREPSIGGHMAKFDKTFPTLDCAACILTPKMSAVRSHENITLWTYSEVVKVEGYVGNYTVTVRRKPRYIIEDLCVGCMECVKSLRLQGAEIPGRIQRGPEQAQADLYPVPASGAAGGADRSGTLPASQDRQMQADLPGGVRRPQGHRFFAEGGTGRDQGGHDHHGHRVQAVRCEAHSAVRLRALPQRGDLAGTGAAGHQFRADRGRDHPARRQQTQDRRVHPVRRLARHPKTTAGARAPAACTR